MRRRWHAREGDAVTAAVLPGRRPAGLAGCVARLGVPALLAGIAFVVARAHDRLPGVSGQFEGSRWFDWSCAAASGAVALSFARALRRPGAPWTLPRSDAWGLGFGAWMGGFLLLAVGLGGALNRAIGDVTRETGRVFWKIETRGKGCHHWVEVEGRAIPLGPRLCMDDARWNALQEGDSIPMGRVASVLGEQVGLMPAPANKDGR